MLPSWLGTLHAQRPSLWYPSCLHSSPVTCPQFALRRSSDGQLPMAMVSTFPERESIPSWLHHHTLRLALPRPVWGMEHQGIWCPVTDTTIVSCHHFWPYEHPPSPGGCLPAGLDALQIARQNGHFNTAMLLESASTLISSTLTAETNKPETASPSVI
eukprot:scaffold187724_cov35-Tisochrysis_lutea.AAC.2